MKVNFFLMIPLFVMVIISLIFGMTTFLRIAIIANALAILVNAFFEGRRILRGRKEKKHDVD